MIDQVRIVLDNQPFGVHVDLDIRAEAANQTKRRLEVVWLDGRLAGQVGELNIPEGAAGEQVLELGVGRSVIVGHRWVEARKRVHLVVDRAGDVRPSAVPRQVAAERRQSGPVS
jgi:hypothetical protein